MTVGVTRTLQGGFWRRSGRPAILAGQLNDGFVLGETAASPLNTGVYPDVIRLPYSGPALIDGYATLAEAIANPIESRNIDRLITVNSGYLRFVNCKFTGGGATFDTGQVDCRKAAVKGVQFERCTFDPANPSPFLNALIGHHMTVHRCYARRVVDFIGVYNTFAPRVDTIITGNYLESLVYYYDPTPGVVHPSDVRTHNDGIQIQGGLGITIVGNTLHGLVFKADGSLPDDELATRADYAHLASQGVIIQENVAVGGIYYGGEAIVKQNRIYGFMHPFSYKTRSTGGTPYDVAHTLNVLEDDDQRYYGTTALVPGYPGRPYIIRTGTQTTINGQSVPTDGQPYPASGENRYGTTTAVERAALRGQLVTIRRDNFPGA